MGNYKILDFFKLKRTKELEKEHREMKLFLMNISENYVKLKERANDLLHELKY